MTLHRQDASMVVKVGLSLSTTEVLSQDCCLPYAFSWALEGPRGVGVGNEPE